MEKAARSKRKTVFFLTFGIIKKKEIARSEAVNGNDAFYGDGK